MIDGIVKSLLAFLFPSLRKSQGRVQKALEEALHSWGDMDVSSLPKQGEGGISPLQVSFKVNILKDAVLMGAFPALWGILHPGVYGERASGYLVPRECSNCPFLHSPAGELRACLLMDKEISDIGSDCVDKLWIDRALQEVGFEEGS